MNDLTILHLSDLHFDDEGERLPILMENLLKDIKDEMQYSENIVIVVTGDIVHKVKYECKATILQFFIKLKEILDERVKHIYIVPGNHDKIRSNIMGNILCQYEIDSDHFYKNNWKYIKVDFEEYLDLVKKIYRIFYSSKVLEQRMLRDTYGVHIDEINGKKICFLLFNTAWSCQGDSDERNLVIGKFQIEKIIEEFNKKRKSDQIDLTIALAHHPVGWLTGKEEDMMKAELICNNRLNANIYICGHIHNRDVINWQNNRHSMTTLVSGLGWPDGSEEHPYAHTYSSYVFNLDVNSIDVYVRSSDDNYSFAPDFRIYTEKRNKEQTKIVMPINICKTQSYFDLGTVKGHSPKACYITDDILEVIRDFILTFNRVRSKMVHQLEKIKFDFKENVICDEQNLPSDDNEKAKILDALNNILIRDIWDDEAIEYINTYYNDFVYMQFTAYLSEICKTINDCIMEIQNDSEIRIHARCWDKVNDSYNQICIYGKGFDRYVMDPLLWGQLLKEAFISGRPLIATVNERYCIQSIKRNNERDSNSWKDFMTVIPKFDKNYYVEKERIYEKIKLERPWITFGVTVYREEDRRLLYVLDFLKLDEIIGDIVKDFLFYFPVDMEGYCAYILGE